MLTLIFNEQPICALSNSVIFNICMIDKTHHLSRQHIYQFYVANSRQKRVLISRQYDNLDIIRHCNILSVEQLCV
jgi:hypothetical protein